MFEDVHLMAGILFFSTTCMAVSIYAICLFNEKCRIGAALQVMAERLESHREIFQDEVLRLTTERDAYAKELNEYKQILGDD